MSFTLVLALLAFRSASCRCVAFSCSRFALAGCSDASEEGRVGGPERSQSARVTRHTDGDTLWLSGIGKVRLIGMDTPEVFGEDECSGAGRRRSSSGRRRSGSRVRYRLGVEERDRYGRALAYVWLTGGRLPQSPPAGPRLAQPLTIPPNDGVRGRVRARGATARARRGGGCGAARLAARA